MNRKELVGFISQHAMKPWMMIPFFKMIEIIFRFANLPIIRKIHPWTRTDKTNMYWVPVYQNLEHNEDVVLPYNLVEEFIDQSSYRVILDICGCRQAHQCKEYPIDIGCLMMGEDAKKIPFPMARPATKEEAKAHLQRAVEANLPPIIGKARIDNFIFNVPDKGKLLTVCFCCECCCISSITNYTRRQDLPKVMPRLPGLEVWVDQDECIGCGMCVDHCFLHLIEVRDGKAGIPEDCRGCGRCARICPQGAIHLKVSDPEYVAKAARRIREYVNPS